MADGITLMHRGRVIDVYEEQVALPNGAHCTLEIARHPGGAAAVALDDAGRVCLLRQYRHAAGGWLWELPAGKLEPGESPAATAARELEEEAGMRAGQWESLGDIFSTPGFCTEVIHLFFARELTSVPRQHDPHEVIEVHWIPWIDAVAQAVQGKLRDAKTVAGLLRARERLELHSKK